MTRRRRNSESGLTHARYWWSVMPLVLLIKLYQWTLSPFIGRQCRYVPTCSNYAIDALFEHGPIRGAWMTVRRIGRCNPLSAGGYDPVAPCDHR
ncbi:MAG TPA: membrane protein insertion efficiency factor YidD [Phycisphaerales bacterium]|nr:membrane protein insertion efficiency factor YidD [Phycisphaerales bacterium]